MRLKAATGPEQAAFDSAMRDMQQWLDEQGTWWKPMVEQKLQDPSIQQRVRQIIHNACVAYDAAKAHK